MDWKAEAKQRLKSYESWKLALQTIPDELKRLQWEPETLEQLVLSQNLQRNLQQAQMCVFCVDRALQRLTPEQRQLLQGFYIHPKWGIANKLLMELGISKSTLYRKKDEALKCFAQAFYGAH